MRSLARVWGIVAALVVVHFFLHVGLGLGGIAPDLLTVALLVGAREIRMGSASALGFAFGMLEDAFSVLAFGANTVAMTLIGAGGAHTRSLFVGDSLLFLISYMFLGKWIRDVIHWMAMGEAARLPFVEALLLGAPLEAAYVAVVGVGIVALLGGSWETVS